MQSKALSGAMYANLERLKVLIFQSSQLVEHSTQLCNDVNAPCIDHASANTSHPPIVNAWYWIASGVGQQKAV